MTEKSHKALIKIIDHCDKIQKYIAGFTLEQFTDDNRTQDAVVFNLSQIGELVRFIDNDVQTTHLQVNWSAMRGMRNHIIHDYDHVKPGVIWSTIKNDLPVLKMELQELADQKVNETDGK